MAFTGPGDEYDDYMGRYSRRLGPMFADFAGVKAGMRAVDVGSGTGLLTRALADVLGGDRVAAAEPSPSYWRATAERVPGADVRQAPAEALPWEDGVFDAALAQLVLPFMTDPAAGVTEMGRVVRPGGTVAAATWDSSGGMTMIATFWRAALTLDPTAPVETSPHRLGDPTALRALWEAAGYRDVVTSGLDAEVAYRDYDDFWRPFTRAVGPAGMYCASLAPTAREELRLACRRQLGVPEGAFTLSARAWAVRGTSPTTS